MPNKPLTINRIVAICSRHHANPTYTRDSNGVHCMIRDHVGRRVTSGYVRF